MISKYKISGITWLDVVNPTTDEVKDVAEKFNIDPEVASDFLSRSLRPRVDFHDSYIYLILHFPALRIGHDDEVDFVIGKDFLITIRYTDIEALHQFIKAIEINNILIDHNIKIHSGHLFFYLTQFLYRNLMNQLEQIGDQVTDIEENIFSGKEKEMVLEISKTKRKLINYRESLIFHDDILKSFEKIGADFFGQNFSNNLRRMRGEYHKVFHTLENIEDTINELRQTNDSLLTTKQNETMKILTIMAFITFPLTLISSIFGMNTTTTPFVGQANDFTIVILMMLSLTTIMFAVFKYKKWL